MKTWTTTSGSKITQILSGRSNVFLLSNPRSNILIDSGPGYKGTKLRKRLHALNINKIDLLFLTHSHFDHTGNAAKIQEIFHARVLIHESEAGFLSTGDNIIPVGTNGFTRILMRIAEKQFRPFARYKPCVPDLTFKERYALSDFGFNACLLHTPGHTEGSASMIIDHEIALVGDAMFGIFPRSVFPPFAGNPGQLIQSWKKLLDTGCKTFIPSHGTANKRSLVEKEYKKRFSK